jgi:thiol:disulfide interchange protein DsbD
MKRIIFIVTLYAFVAIAALAQFQNPVTMTATQKKVGDDALEIIFQGSVDAGWHVYGTDIADGGPTRAELTIEKQKGLKPDGKLRATGKVQKAMDDMFGMEVSYMEEKASFVQRFTITEPEYEVAGYLTYGACNDENCISPTDVEFRLEKASPQPSPRREKEQEDEFFIFSFINCAIKL